MTIPSERTRSVERLKNVSISIYMHVASKHPKFLRSKTKEFSVPASLIRELYHAMRHYPGYSDLFVSSQMLGTIWGKPTEIGTPWEQDTKEGVIKCR